MIVGYTSIKITKEEIERRIENLKISLDKNCVTEESKLDIRGNITALYSLLKFINSLPEEPASDDLEEELNNYIKDNFCSITNFGSDRIGFLSNRTKGELDRVDLVNIVSHFAEWQRKKDQQAIELAEDHAMLAGMEKMQEEMMKDAVDCDVFKKEDNIADLRWKDNTAFERLVSKFNDGDKVKIIIVKEE